MRNELISYKIVKLAKSKGIDFRSVEFQECSIGRNKAGTYHAYVTQTLLQRYLREKYIIEIIPYPIEMKNDIKTFEQTSNIDYAYFMYINGISQFVTGIGYGYNTYEKAMDAGLYAALNTLDNGR
jgi:hypothetical protein